MDDCVRSDPKLILCLVPNDNAERYLFPNKCTNLNLMTIFIEDIV